MRDKRLWFEGPILPLPESQQQEDYPADMRGTVTPAKDAALGPVRGRVSTSQGGAGGLVFVVGDLPEVVEREIDGDALPEALRLPVTANGQRGLIDSHVVWNATANFYVNDRLDLYATVKNLADEDYVVDMTRGLVPGMPQLVQAGFTARF